jgi:hypothetical protein
MLALPMLNILSASQSWKGRQHNNDSDSDLNRPTSVDEVAGRRIDDRNAEKCGTLFPSEKRPLWQLDTLRTDVITSMSS